MDVSEVTNFIGRKRWLWFYSSIVPIAVDVFVLRCGAFSTLPLFYSLFVSHCLVGSLSRIQVYRIQMNLLLLYSLLNHSYRHFMSIFASRIEINN